jgi:putative colanic acid biosynthesis acetyltransferase WcaF
MTDPDLDIAANRSARKYDPAELIRRVLWGIGAVVFRWTPRLLYGVRNGLLRLFGAEVGPNVRIHPRATIYFPWNLTIGDWSSVGEDALIYNLGPVTIGEQVTISQRTHLCAGTHDATDPAMPLQKPPINVGNQAWVCADAFVGPGVTIGDGVVIGARSVVVDDIDEWTVVAGNPAEYIKQRRLEK